MRDILAEIKALEIKLASSKSEFKSQLLAKGYSAEVVAKALAKAERWMRKAFGGVDWNEIELGTIEAFCKDTQKNPEGKNTFNRGGS